MSSAKIEADIHWGSMIFSAFRYALGRHTGVVTETTGYIIENLGLLQNKWVIMMKREISEYLRGEGCVGIAAKYSAEFEREAWSDLEQLLTNEIRRRLDNGEMREDEIA